jgi:4-amino-4-deoxy-L-arabinose transferase-like glycosyltransferase
MEAAGALQRSSLASYLEAAREAIRSRSRAFWIVAGLTVLGAGLRFATLGVQAYHHDEIITASRLLRKDFWHVMDAVGWSESAPPLYYAGAWLWTQVAGTGEFGLRSFSALAGVATVPVAYLLGAELSGRRTGLVTAALVAVNPMLLWYSQEARGYALLVLLTAVAALYFLRTLERGRRSDAIAWGVASALALATHYFAVFPIALEALWLLRRRRPAIRPGIWVPLATAILLAPLAVHQMSFGHAEWIGDRSLGHRLWESAVTFAVGETGDVIARPERLLPALLPLLTMLGALLLLALRGDRRERRAGGRMLVLASSTVLGPLLIAVAVPGKDFVLARNLIPALVPLLAAVAVGATLGRGRRAGAMLAAVLAAYSLGFCIWASASTSLQRPDWKAVAAALGEPHAPRAMVTWTLGGASLRHYLSTGSFQVAASDGYSFYVHEIDFISDGPAPPVPQRLIGPRFRPAGGVTAGRFRIRRYAVPGGELAHLPLRTVHRAETNFPSNSVLLDGIGVS